MKRRGVVRKRQVEHRSPAEKLEYVFNLQPPHYPVKNERKEGKVPPSGALLKHIADVLGATVTEGGYVPVKKPLFFVVRDVLAQEGYYLSYRQYEREVWGSRENFESFYQPGTALSIAMQSLPLMREGFAPSSKMGFAAIGIVGLAPKEEENRRIRRFAKFNRAEYSEFPDPRNWGRRKGDDPCFDQTDYSAPASSG